MWPVFDFVCVCVCLVLTFVFTIQVMFAKAKHVFGLFEARLRERHSFRQLQLPDCRFLNSALFICMYWKGAVLSNRCA